MGGFPALRRRPIGELRRFPARSPQREGTAADRGWGRKMAAGGGRNGGSPTNSDTDSGRDTALLFAGE